jgi:hypothetical protein
MDEKQRIELVHNKVMELIRITNELEEIYPEKSFKLDGILLGNIGEVLASYHYGIRLFRQSEPTHDGEVMSDGKLVQIKITQSNNIILRECPDYMLILYLDRANGEVTEIYNGAGQRVWEASRYVKQMNHYSISVPKLIQLREQIADDERIRQEHPVKRYERNLK